MNTTMTVEELTHELTWRFKRVPRATLSIWAPQIAQVSLELCDSVNLTPLEFGAAIGAIIWRESFGGIYLSPPDETGVGDGGHGRGLMQIDDRTHQAFLAMVDAESGKYLWQIAEHNIRYGAEKVFCTYMLQLGCHLKDAFSAYNRGVAGVKRSLAAGEDPDLHTTGHDYGRDVLSKMKSILA